MRVPCIFLGRAYRKREQECFLQQWNVSGSKDSEHRLHSSQRATYPFLLAPRSGATALRLLLHQVLHKWRCGARFLPNQAQQRFSVPPPHAVPFRRQSWRNAKAALRCKESHLHPNARYLPSLAIDRAKLRPSVSDPSGNPQKYWDRVTTAFRYRKWTISR